MRTSISRVTGRLAEAYENALEYIEEHLKENGILRVEADYSDTRERCFNINRHDGTTDLITEAFLDTEQDGHLTLTGASGTLYPVGTDYDGQDNYILANIDALVMACDRAVKVILAKCITLPTVRSIDNLRNALRKKLSTTGGDFAFNHTEPSVAIREGKLRTISGYKAVWQPEGASNLCRTDIDVLSLKETVALIAAVNAEVKASHCRKTEASEK